MLHSLLNRLEVISHLVEELPLVDFTIELPKRFGTLVISNPAAQISIWSVASQTPLTETFLDQER